MRTKRSKFILALAAAACAAAVPAWAQHREAGERPHFEPPLEHGPVGDRPFHEDRFRSQHWMYDSHHHLNHYFPARGEVVPALPGAALGVDFHGGHYFFHDGVFFRPEGAHFTVIMPPLGLVIPVLPTAYATVWAAGVPYYYANDVYYAAAPGGGYVVTAPPPVLDDSGPIAEAPAGSPPPPSSPADPIAYPRNNQTPEQTAADRANCNEWATTQVKGNDPTAFRRAFAACMDARGYTVR